MSVLTRQQFEALVKLIRAEARYEALEVDGRARVEDHLERYDAQKEAADKLMKV